jgi:hypothetical protein
MEIGFDWISRYGDTAIFLFLMLGIFGHPVRGFAPPPVPAHLLGDAGKNALSIARCAGPAHILRRIQAVTDCGPVAKALALANGWVTRGW